MNVDFLMLRREVSSRLDTGTTVFHSFSGHLKPPAVAAEGG